MIRIERTFESLVRCGAVWVLAAPCACARLPSAASRTAPTFGARDVPAAQRGEDLERADDPRVRWQHEIGPPRLVRPPGQLPRRLAEECGAHDEGLAGAARRLATLKAGGGGSPDAPELELWLRAAGTAYVWPRIWSLEGRRIDAELASARLGRWLGHAQEEGPIRCGIATAVTAAGTTIVVAVAVNALADLTVPVPSSVRAGQWLPFEADVLVPAADAELLVMGPDVAPHAVPTEWSDGHARARFRVDRPGKWVAQLIVATEHGTRPVLETTVYADRPLPTAPEVERDPWPGRGAHPAPAALELGQWINTARQVWGLAPLDIDQRLNAVAQRHAELMLATGRLGHQAGDGDPGTRVRAAVPESRLEGENVARATTLAGAQRAIWASPSHRANILQGRFDSVGTGVARDSRGFLWVCEVFSDTAGR